MSRVERHKARREGQITGVGKDSFVSEEEVVLEDKFDVNPIIRQDENEIRRKKSYEKPSARNTLNIEEIKEKASGSKTELFDIEDAFKKLEREHRAPDYDTQMEIMSELFSNNAVEYNSIDFTKDESTNKIMISEEELMKLLEEREQVHSKLLNRKRRKDKKREEKDEKRKEKEIREELKEVNRDVVEEVVVEAKEITAPYLKEDLQVEEVHEIKKEDAIKNRISDSLDSFDDLEKSLNKRPWILYVVIIVLIIVFGILIYTFFK